MKIVRSADDVVCYDVLYTNDLSIFETEFTDDDFFHIDGLQKEDVAIGAALGVLYAGDYVYAAVMKDIFGYLEDGTYGMKSCKVIKEYYADVVADNDDTRKYS